MHGLSDAERAYIEGGAAKGVREDGRGRLDLRAVTVETNVLGNAAGSARVRIGDVTDVLVGISGVVGVPRAETGELGELRFSVDVSSVASPIFAMRGARVVNAELGEMLTRIYSGMKELRRGLCLVKGRKCWWLDVDVVVLDGGGNVGGAVSIGVWMALGGLRLPRVVVREGEGDEEEEIVVDEERFVEVSGTGEAPVTVTMAKVGEVWVADCSEREEACIGAAVTVGVARGGRVCGTAFEGVRGAEMTVVERMIVDAVKVGAEILVGCDRFLKDNSC